MKVTHNFTNPKPLLFPSLVVAMLTFFRGPKDSNSLTRSLFIGMEELDENAMQCVINRMNVTVKRYAVPLW